MILRWDKVSALGIIVRGEGFPAGTFRHNFPEGHQICYCQYCGDPWARIVVIGPHASKMWFTRPMVCRNCGGDESFDIFAYHTPSIEFARYEIERVLAHDATIKPRRALAR